MRLAITGATGFVGSHLLDAALAAGHEVKALTRSKQHDRDGVDWVVGDLSSRDALEWLVDQADAVIHVAGTINAPNKAGFEEGNVAGTLAMLAAATAGGIHRFVHVSSLAAREPKLSLYGASKQRGEELVHSSGLDWAIVRPPAVYGPGDRETLELFRMARLGLMLMPPKGRVSVIHADDLARLLLALAEPIGAGELPRRARRRKARRLDPPRIRQGARRGGRHQGGGHLLPRSAPSPRRPRRPASSVARRPSSPPTAPPISPTATGWSNPSAPPPPSCGARRSRRRTGSR